MNGYGLGQGIAEGLKTVQQGMIQAENITNKRTAIQQAAELHKLKVEGASKSVDYKALQIQQLESTVKQLEVDKLKETTFNAFKGFVNTQDPTDLNNAIAKSPKLKEMLSRKGGSRFVDPEELSEQTLTNMGYDKAKGFMEYPAIVQKEDGSYGIMNMFEIMGSSGYVNQMSKYEKEQVDSRLNELQIKQEELNIEDKEIDNDTNALKLEDMENFLAENPDATLSDYLKQKNSSNFDPGSAQKDINTFDANYPDATKEERDEFVKKVMNKRVAGIESNRNKDKDKDLTNNQIDAIKLVNSEDYNKEDAIRLETEILNDLDQTRKVIVKKAISDMTANHKMVVSINRILKEADEGEVKVDKDAIANTKTYLDKIFGNDVPQSFKNADFDTAGGLLLAGFMKDISGTAVGVAEAERLTRIFAAGDLADEEFVKNSMAKFSSETDEANKIIRDNNIQYIPDTAVKLSTYGSDKPKEEVNEPEVKSNTIKISGQYVNIEKEDDTYIYVRNPQGQLVRIPKGAK